jgi:hypothetical protein
MIIPLLAEAGTDKWEHYSFVATVFAAIWAAVWAVKQWRDETAKRREDLVKERETKRAELLQREQELRWKQAELARTLLDEIFDYGPSNDAWRMVDGEKIYTDDKDNEYHITMEIVRQALPKPWNDESSGSNLYIRWCFDALFYYLERLEQSVQVKLVRFEDLAAPTAYYIALMAKDKKIFQDYAELIRFHRAVQFLERFPEWRDTKV